MSHVDITKTFGERCIVADRSKIKAKPQDRGKECCFLGHSPNHAPGTTCRLCDPTTKKTTESRDARTIRELEPENQAKNDETPATRDEIVTGEENEKRVAHSADEVGEDVDGKQAAQSKDLVKCMASTKPSDM